MNQGYLVINVSLSSGCHMNRVRFNKMVDMYLYLLIAGEYVASGSDDGKWFIWEKNTGRLIKILVGDDAGTNLFFSSSIPFCSSVTC